ncbi:MAG: hypothetical protein WBW93_17905, partial [Steroidobacteraceae bacterium]
LFTTAIDMIQTLSAAAAVGAGELKRTMQRYLKPALLICDLCCALRYVELADLGIWSARRTRKTCSTYSEPP